MNPRFDDLIALAALGELTGAEAIELDDAVSNDDEVAAALADALAVAAALQATARETPPASMRASVLQAIASVSQETARTPGVTHDAVTSMTSAPDTHLDVTPEVSSMDRARMRRFAPVLAAAAALLLVVGGGVLVTTFDSGSNDPIAAVVDAGDVSTRRLDGELGGSIEVSYSQSESALVITGDAVPATDLDQTYQLWLIGDSDPTSVGVFRPDENGRVEARFDDIDPSNFVLGVTREPTGGSERPTLPILASA